MLQKNQYQLQTKKAASTLHKVTTQNWLNST